MSDISLFAIPDGEGSPSLELAVWVPEADPRGVSRLRSLYMRWLESGDEASREAFREEVRRVYQARVDAHVREMGHDAKYAPVVSISLHDA